MKDLDLKVTVRLSRENSLRRTNSNSVTTRQKPSRLREAKPSYLFFLTVNPVMVHMTLHFIFRAQLHISPSPQGDEKLERESRNQQNTNKEGRTSLFGINKVPCISS